MFAGQELVGGFGRAVFAKYFKGVLQQFFFFHKCTLPAFLGGEPSRQFGLSGVFRVRVRVSKLG